MIDIRDEALWQHSVREALLDCAFGTERFGKTCERLREGRLPAIALVATDAVTGTLIGTVRLWNVASDDGRRALLLGPLAIADDRQGEGLGGRMMRAALNRASVAGHQSVILVGDADYYTRFGFDVGLTRGLDLPGPVERERFLGLELVDGGLSGARGILRADGAFEPDVADRTRGPWGRPKLRLDA